MTAFSTPTAFDRIPVIDFGPFLDGTGKAAVAEALGAACRDVGFFYVRNHGVAESVITEAFDQAARFFALPEAQKTAIHISNSYPNQRGYVPLFHEELDTGLSKDMKECFDMGRVLAPDDPDLLVGTPFHGPNVWPDGLDGFQAALETYHGALLDFSDAMVRAVALSLGLREEYFRDKMDRAIANLRLIHYLPHDDVADEAVVGCGAHSDYGFMTFLAQDDAGGLQVQNADGQWIDAPPLAGTFVVNIGELLAQWTNDAFVATPHRVAHVSGGATGRGRYSLPFFLDTNYDAVVECIASCTSAERPARYGPTLGGAYLAKRLDETFPFRRRAQDLPGTGG